MKKIVSGSLLLLLLLLSGCSKDQLLITVYSAPKESKKIQSMIDDKSTTGGDYLVLGINPEVQAKNSINTQDFNRLLVADMQTYLTQTNFITVHPIYSDAQITLDMSIVNYNYQETSNGINADLSVEFIVMKNASRLFSKTYLAKQKLYSKAGRSVLPSKGVVLAKMSKSVTKKFSKDITPLKTKKLVELKSLPDEISYTINMAIAGNFEGAIKGMQRYKDDKEMEYYFNLAVYYEGLAAQTEKLVFLHEANKNYEKAMAMGGNEDEHVIKEVSKFDRFYKLFKMIKKQSTTNQLKADQINQEYGLIN